MTVRRRPCSAQPKDVQPASCASASIYVGFSPGSWKSAGARAAARRDVTEPAPAPNPVTEMAYPPDEVLAAMADPTRREHRQAMREHC